MTRRTKDAAATIKDAFAGAETIEGAAPAAQDDGREDGVGQLPANCPVQPLGQTSESFFFLDSQRQFHAFEVAKLSRLKIIQMFGNRNYLWTQWPNYNKEGDVTGWKIGIVTELLSDACVARGMFDPIHKIRGPGAWRDAQGRLVFHCGNELWLGRHPQRPGMIGDVVYPSGVKLPPPLFDGLDDEYSPARELLETIMSWNWKRGEIDAKLVLAWHGAALLGAAQPWRPMMWVTGDAGTGKSTLFDLTVALLGDGGLVAAANATGAGLFQTLGFRSLPVAVDELEADADDKKQRQVIELARLASSGANIIRGSAGGTAVEFQARSAFRFSSVLIPELTPAEKSRMTICELGPVQSKEKLGDMTRWKRVGQQLRGVLLREWSRYDATFTAYRAALLKANHSARSADQYAALGAAYDLLMHSKLDESSAAAWAAMLPARDLAELSDETPDHAMCLNYLLTVAPEIFRGGKTETIAYWARLAREKIEKDSLSEDADEDAIRILASVGIRVMVDPRTKHYEPRLRHWYIAVANNHVGLARLFAQQRWKGGGWSQALRRVEIEHDGEMWRASPTLGTRSVMWLDGRSSRCTFIPWIAAFPPRKEEE